MVRDAVEKEIFKTKRKLMSISIIGVKLWNQLHANVQNVKTINLIFVYIHLRFPEMHSKQFVNFEK